MKSSPSSRRCQFRMAGFVLIVAGLFQSGCSSDQTPESRPAASASSESTDELTISNEENYTDIRPETSGNINDLSFDLEVPAMVVESPEPGKRVRATLEAYEDTKVHHSLFLPVDWEPGQRYPVIVEYAGNGTYSNNLGDICNGVVDECNLGFGISGGKGFIWICLPFVSRDGNQNQIFWWGDVDATVEYCRAAVEQVCSELGGDRNNVFISGFSRGSIACNYIGLHNDEIAKLWRGFICHSHYDGTAEWAQGTDQELATERLARLNGRPQFISHEQSVEKTKSYLQQHCPDGNFEFLALAFPNHTDKWVLQPGPHRDSIRKWIREVIANGE